MTRSLPLLTLMSVLATSIWWGVSARGDYSQISLTLALTLVWGALTAEAIERGLLQRRLWVSYAINPSARLYRLLWGGALFMLIRAVIVAPVALLLFCHLLTQGSLEWSAVGIITALTLFIRARAHRRVSEVCSPIYSEYLSRRASVFISALMLTPLFLSATLFTSQKDLRNMSLHQAVARVDPSEELPAPFHIVQQASSSLEGAYSWCVQVVVTELDSYADRGLRYLLLALFVLHKTLVAFAAARLISGMVTLGEFERVKLRLSLIGQQVRERSAL